MPVLKVVFVLLTIISNFLGKNLPLIIAVVGICISIKKYLDDRPQLSVKLSDSKAASLMFVPNRDEPTNPDPYWHRPYRVMMDVIITNKSAKPISISSFSLNDDASFFPSFKISDNYTVLIEDYANVDISKGKLSTLEFEQLKNSKRLEMIFPAKTQRLALVLDLPPYSSRRGAIVFAMASKEDVHINQKNTIVAETSRGTFSYQLDVYKYLQNVYKFPEKYRPENIQTDDDIFEKGNDTVL